MIRCGLDSGSENDELFVLAEEELAAPRDSSSFGSGGGLPFVPEQFRA